LSMISIKRSITGLDSEPVSNALSLIIILQYLSLF